jgi:hypothetical protein
MPDDQRGPFRRPLYTGPRRVDVHEEAHPNVKHVDYALIFQPTLTPKPVGREDKGAATYGKDDLPNLRAAATADLLALITDDCTAPGAADAAARRASNCWTAGSTRSSATRTGARGFICRRSSRSHRPGAALSN